MSIFATAASVLDPTSRVAKAATAAREASNTATKDSGFWGTLKNAVMGAPEAYKQTATKVGQIEAGIVQGTIRSGASAGLDLESAMERSATGRPATSQTIVPKTALEKIVFGEEPIKPLSTRVAEAEITLPEGKALPFGIKASPKLALPGLIGLTALDFTGAGGEKNLVKILAKADDVSFIAKTLRSIGVGEDLVMDASKTFASLKDEASIKRGLDQITEFQKTTSGGARGALAEASRTPSPRLEQGIAAFDEGVRGATERATYESRILETARQAKAEGPNQTPGLFQKIKNALSPAKATDKETQTLFQEWSTRSILSKELANTEARKLGETAEAGIQTVYDYQAGKATKYSDKIKAAFDALFKESKERGFDFRYKNNYLPQVYSNSTEEVTNAMAKFMKDKGVDEKLIIDYLKGKPLPDTVAARLQLSPSFTKASAFPDYATAAQYGLQPKYSNPAQLLGYYRQELERSVANREFLEGMIERGKILPADLAPTHYKPIDLAFAPQGYYAEPATAKLLNGLFKSQGDLGVLETVAGGVAILSRRAQELKLSAGVPMSNINFFSIGQLVKEMTAGNFTAVVPFLRANFNEASIKFFNENQKFIRMIGEQGLDITHRVDSYEKMYKAFSDNKGFIAKAGETFDKLFNEKTFASFMPQLHIQTFKDAYYKSMAMGKTEAEAQKFAGEVTKAFHGISENLGRSKSTQDTLAATFFAPKFRESIVNVLFNTAKSVTTEIRNPAFYKNRRLLAGMATTLGLYDLANKEFSGHHMWENPPGKELAMMIPRENGEVVYVDFMPSFLAFARNLTEGAFALGKGDLDTAVQKGGTVFSMPITLATDVLGNSDYFGREIYKDDDSRADKALKIGKYLGLQVNHPYVAELINQLSEKKPLYQSISIALEMPLKFSSMDKISKGQMYDALDNQTKLRAAEKKRVQPIYDKVQALDKAGKSIEAQQLVDTLSDDDYAIYKTIRATDKRRQTTDNETRIYPIYQQVQKLKEQGRIEEAQVIVNGFSDEDYKAYQLLKKKFQ